MPRVNVAILTFVIVLILLFIFWKLSSNEPDQDPTRNTAVGSNQILVDSNGRSTKGMVTIYYETLCPDSRHFLVRQFAPVYSKYSSSIDYQLIPYGKAQTLGRDQFKCQHGPPECEGNKVHACAIHLIKDQRVLVDYINCMIMDNRDPQKIGKKCASEIGDGIKWDGPDSIVECLQSQMSNDLLKDYGEKTHNLSPPVSFIPTIEFNGSQEGQPEMLKDFERFFCKHVVCL